MPTSAKQRGDVIAYLHHQLFLSPLLTEEHKKRLDGILRANPSDEFLKGLHGMLQEEQRQFEAVLATMSEEELKEVHHVVVTQERQQQRQASQEKEEATKEEEAQFLEDMEAYFSSH